MHETAPIVDLSRAVALARRRWRERIVDVCEWALAQGRPVTPDLIALILISRDEWDYEEGFDIWTRYGVYEFLWADVFNWCGLNRVLIPDGIPEALWTYLHYLREHRLFDPGSDPFRELLRPLRCYGGLGPDGREEPEGKRRRVKCVCKIPYESKRRRDGG